MIKALKPLVMMQLKDKLDFSFLKSTKQTIVKVILSILAFAIVAAAFFLLFFMGDMMNIFSLSISVPTPVVVILFTVMETLTLLSCTFGLMKALLNPVTVQPTEQVIGAMLCAWEMTYEQEITIVMSHLAIFSERTWTTKRVRSFEEYLGAFKPLYGLSARLIQDR